MDEKMRAYVAHVNEMEKKIRALTVEEREHICNMGYYNDTIKGYLIRAMKEAKFTDDDIRKALGGMRWALDEMDAADAAATYIDF